MCKGRDLGVLKNDATARCLWKIAKVTKLIESKDGKIRRDSSFGFERETIIFRTVALIHTD